jgi:hypothetical protein
MTSNLTQRLIQLEDLIPETNVVATIRQDVETISNQNNLEFQESYEDKRRRADAHGQPHRSQ